MNVHPFVTLHFVYCGYKLRLTGLIYVFLLIILMLKFLHHDTVYSSVNQDKKRKVEVRRRKEKNVKAPS